MTTAAMRFAVTSVLGLASVALAATGAGAVHAQEISADQAAAVRQGVQATLDAYHALGAAGRWDALMRLYADDPRFRWVANGTIEARSVDEIRRYFMALSPGTRVETIYQDAEITPLSPDIAQAVTSFQTRVVDPNGKGFGFGGILTMTFVKRADGWKILNGHSSSPIHRPQ